MFQTGSHRTNAIEPWLWRYSYQRKHGALGRKPRAARFTQLNNLLGSYTY